MKTEQELQQYLLEKRGATLDFPFGNDVSVFKVKNKMFALLTHRNDMLMINLKCDPDQALMLRDIFSAITAGYHMDKRHWISIYFDPNNPVPDNEVLRLVDQSYSLVVKTLAKKLQAQLL
ncbi:MmcQ/YjbR family DNA-binding protein [Thalassotalea ponticola]|uniref:MmcQ/YjbR family DNA-binding protein n=1 Tax=Thalassotalea ponticola TaxID=1523392 RepID=UPI0025B2B7EC|nr:MmcQ/YjbR family DNA-binding protein [Thalassotalea ponticola]MDN3651208.1 MmcQ/YjbR family DNA-binding protein [Thalassotalea ponticola]